MYIIINYVILLLLLSCFSKEDSFSQAEIWDLISQNSKDAKIVPIANHEIHRRVVCKNYGPGCINGTGKRIAIKGIEFLIIRFQSPEKARTEARRINQWYVRDWILDDIKNEPVLEKFMIRTFKGEAKEALPEID